MSSIVTPSRKFFSFLPLVLKVKFLMVAVEVSIAWPMTSMTCASSDLTW